MKVILIHGNDSEKLQQRLNKFIDSALKRGWHLDRLSENADKIGEKIKGVSLFGQESLFLLENPQKLNKTRLSFIKQQKKTLDGTLVIYSETIVSKTVLGTLPKVDKEEKYELPVLIWKFLDSFYPGNAKECLKLFHKILKKEPAEKILALLSSYLRDVAIAKKDKELLGYPSWRLSKLSKTAEKFKNNDLKKIIRKFSSADVSAKTGRGNLANLLDLIILTRLE